MDNNGRIYRYGNDRPMALYPSIMVACGVHEAVIISILQDALYGARGIDGDGDDFVKLELDDFVIAIPFLSTKEIKKAITSLIKQNVIKGEGNIYSINWVVLNELIAKGGS